MGKINLKGLLARVDSEESLKNGLKIARQVILSGGVVAFPTESFYGLAVNTRDEGAIQSLFDIKQRPNKNPVLILVPSQDHLDTCVARIPETALILMKQFWPGGLTIVFAAGPNVSPLLTAGTGKIGIRLSSHPVAAALAGIMGAPITATSANLSGAAPCISAEEVYESLGDSVDLILDGGKTEGGKGSTILDVTVFPPKVLREGMIGCSQLRKYVDLWQAT